MESFRAWVKRRSRELAEDWPPGSRDEQDLIEHWKAHRPKMAARFRAEGILGQAAHVLIQHQLAAEKEMMAAGMPYPDAREQSTADWLMMEPETDDHLLPDPTIS